MTTAIEQKREKLARLKVLRAQRQELESGDEQESVEIEKMLANIPVVGDLAAFGQSASDAMFPSIDIPFTDRRTPGMKDVRGLIQGLTGRLTGEKPPAQRMSEALETENPVMTELGEMAPNLVRTIAAYAALGGTSPHGAGILEKAIPAAKGGKLATIANIIRGGGIGAGANVAASQAFNPDVERLGSDVKYGALFGAGGKLMQALQPALRNWSSNLYSSVLKRGRQALESEARRGGTLEQEMARRGIFSPTVGRLAKKASKKVEKLEKKITPIIEKIKAKVDTGKVVDELNALKNQHMGPTGYPVHGMERQVQVIDDMIESVGKQYGKAGKLTAKQATDLKRTLYRSSRKVLSTTETGPITKEAQMAEAIGWKGGVEEAADTMGGDLGKLVSKLNKEQGFWLNLEKASEAAKAAQGKTFVGKYILPASLGAGGYGVSRVSKPAGAATVGMGLAMTPVGRLMLASGLGKGANLAPLMKYLPAIAASVGGVEGESQ